jgi:CheY-like chemotaxis protein
MPKILIVDDVELNVDLLMQLLEDDYELSVAIDGEQALAKTAEEKPDLILMDMSMPKVDGYEAARRLKNNPATNHTPIIGLSSYAMAGDAQKALEAGCNDYLTKPIDEDKLFQMLYKYLGKKK